MHGLATMKRLNEQNTKAVEILARQVVEKDNLLRLALETLEFRQTDARVAQMIRDHLEGKGE